MEHDFEPLSGRCRNCGTAAGQPNKVVCPQQGTRAEPLRPEPARREFAVDDAETIHARMIELEADRLAVRSQPAPEMADQRNAVDVFGRPYPALVGIAWGGKVIVTDVGTIIVDTNCPPWVAEKMADSLRQRGKA